VGIAIRPKECKCRPNELRFPPGSSQQATSSGPEFAGGDGSGLYGRLQRWRLLGPEVGDIGLGPDRGRGSRPGPVDRALALRRVVSRRADLRGDVRETFCPASTMTYPIACNQS
jgi:hypothetical protein